MRRLLIAAALVLLVPAAAAATIAERLAACLSCHGEQGQSANPDVPSLGAQPAFYLMVQLVMFRERIRPIEPMTEMLRGTSDTDLRDMADFIAELPAPRPPMDPIDPAAAERARLLIAQHRCNFCHNADFSGHEGAPRLAGQREDYLLKALRGYKDNTRRAYEPQMADVVTPLSNADFADLAALLARAR
jgi:cytochrome c553